MRHQQNALAALYTPPAARPNIQRTMQQQEGLGLYLFLCVFEEGMSISETISVARLFTDATQGLHCSIS